MTWLFFMGLQGALWSVAGLALAQLTWRLWPRVPLRKQAMAAGLPVAVLLAAGLFAFALYSRAAGWFGFDWPLEDFTWRMTALAGIGVLVASLAVLNMWFALARIQSLARIKKPIAETLMKFQEYRDTINTCFLVLSALVAAAVFSYGRLQAAIVAMLTRAYQLAGIANSETAAKLAERVAPSQAPYLYGAFFTGLLAFVYIGVLVRSNSGARRLRENILPISTVEAKAFGEAYQNRERLDKLLRLDLPAMEIVQTTTAILAPLASGLFASL
jgi:hypothetical protein